MPLSVRRKELEGGVQSVGIAMEIFGLLQPGIWLEWQMFFLCRNAGPLACNPDCWDSWGGQGCVWDRLHQPQNSYELLWLWSSSLWHHHYSDMKHRLRFSFIDAHVVHAPRDCNKPAHVLDCSQWEVTYHSIMHIIPWCLLHSSIFLDLLPCWASKRRVL